jgi:hypothetical protein
MIKELGNSYFAIGTLVSLCIIAVFFFLDFIGDIAKTNRKH